MIRGMYSAISGLKNHQVMLDVTSNNLANVNTVGYKGARTTFKDQLQQTSFAGSAAGGVSAGASAAQVGLGVQLGAISVANGQGSLQATGNTFDIAVQGEGWFRVGAGTPPAAFSELQYTRAGNFSRNDQGYLTTVDGFYVVGRTGGTDGYIQIPAGATSVSVGSDGAISYIPGAGGARVTAGTVSLARFPNDGGLLRASGNRWTPSPASGAETVGTPGTGGYGATIGGTLEMSNVDVAAEFTSMIMAQRGFQASSRVISAADEMMQELVNIKR